MKHNRTILLVLLGSFLLAGNASAHRVNVFAWAEGDMVYVEGKFSGGKKIMGGKIIVTDSSGIEMLSGHTNNQGQFSFKRPQPKELKIVLEAGMGHRAEWTLPIDAGRGAHSAEDSQSEPVPAPNEPKNSGEPYFQTAKTPIGNYTGPSRVEIEAIVEKALDKKMEPVLKMLAESHAKGPGIADILGGIGYIIGLVGIAAYFHSRKKKN